MLDFFFWLFFVLLFVVCLFLILLVLIQKGRGGGLSNAFGGGGGNTAFGSKTGDVLTWATSIVFGVFMLLAVGLNLVTNAREQKLHPKPPSVTVTAPAPPAAPR
jgi:preprotein translocase subunit SecG